MGVLTQWLWKFLKLLWKWSKRGHIYQVGGPFFCLHPVHTSLNKSLHFQVYNVVPSISAVTGISPGRYLWRVVIAFHIGPRILIAAVYYNFLMSFVPFLASASAASASATTSTASVASKAADEAAIVQQPDKAEWLTKLLKCCYYLQVSEVVGLCAISFVHNREHYREY